MNRLGWFLVALIPAAATAAQPPAHTPPAGTPPMAITPAVGKAPVDLAPLVDKLVADITTDSRTQARSFRMLIALGTPAVPYVVAHLGDSRALPEQSIWVAAPTGREDTQYHPWYVHDGLLAVLKELTGYTKAPMTGHLLPSQRAKSVRKWVAYCSERFPTQVSVCQRALQNSGVSEGGEGPEVADASR